jgi:DNA (cytosine-5)-methyltransferase 1
VQVSKTKQKKKYDSPTVVSLFTCGMGMDRGFEEAKFQTVYANDITKFACNTIREIKKKEIEEEKTLHLDEGSIMDISSTQILENIDLAVEEVDVIIGGPPCQSFSTAGMRKGLNDKRGMAVLEYIKKVKEIRPKSFVFENVQGITSMAMSQISFYDRIVMDESKLTKSQKRGSLFEYIEKEFRELEKEEFGYSIDFDILNAADYGIPQNRKRFILIGMRNDIGNAEEVMDIIKSKAKYADPEKIKSRTKLEEKAVKYQGISDKALENNKPEKSAKYQEKADKYKTKAEKIGTKKWKTLESIQRKFEGANPKDCAKFSPNTMKFLKHIPKGGCWTSLSKKMQVKAMGGAADTDDPRRKGKQGGRTGFYRRLSWGKPSPTLVTSPTQMGTLMCHPEYERPLSLKEYALIQGFPVNWKFKGTLSEKYRMIGEAVPVDLANLIAKVIYKFCND